MSVLTPLVADTDVLEIGTRAIILAVKLAGPPLAAALITGLIVSLFQAVFQVQDQSLTMVPKMAAVAVAFVICGPWMLKEMVSFTAQLYGSIPIWLG